MFAAAVLTLVPARPVAAQRTGLLAPRELGAVRAAGPIQIDGELDEPAWAQAPVGDRFIQERPRPGEESTLVTRVRVLFDDRALYIGVRLADPRPDRIQAPLGRRDDESNSDWCFVELDSRHDRRTAFSFGVNPAGMQVDGQFVNDSTYDSSWDAVWEASARIDAEGWAAEYRIPFAALSFQSPPPGTAMTWGLNVYRSHPGTGELSNWSPHTPELAGVVSLFNELSVPASPRVRRFSITPYGSVQLTRSRPGDADPEARAGADLEAGLPHGFALAATVLPDFGQVEADPTQLNLTSFELFQQERRPFFTGGTDSFQFDTSLPLTSRDNSFAEEAPFYSRRIGRAPEGDLPPGAVPGEVPAATTILGAAKLFGRTASGWRTGVLAAWTDGERVPVDPESPDGATSWPVAPSTQAVVARVVKESADGDAAAGAFASGLHRATGDGPLADQLTRTDGALGLDGRIRWAGQTNELRAWVLGTAQGGTAAAIARLGDQPWHNLQRMDAPRLRLPAGATHLTGAAGEVRLARVGGALQGNVSARAVAPGFDVNALGFQRSSDWLLASAQWRRDWWPRTRALRRVRVGSSNAAVGWTLGGERRASVVDAYTLVELTSYWDVTATLQHELTTVSTEWLRGGPGLLLPPRELGRLVVNTDTRRLTHGSLEAVAWIEPGSGSRSLSLSPAATWRLTDMVAGSVGATIEDQQIGWQLVAGPGPAPEDTYVVARVRQRAASFSLKADVALSPRFIVQLYAQPFATTGRYDDYAELVAPRASSASDRFARIGRDRIEVDATTVSIRDGGAGWAFPRPDGVQRTLTASAVVRWELAPGSFLTGVWSHRGDAAVAGPTGRLTDQIDDSLTEPGTDVLLVKLGWRWAP